MSHDSQTVSIAQDQDIYAVVAKIQHKERFLTWRPTRSAANELVRALEAYQGLRPKEPCRSSMLSHEHSAAEEIKAAWLAKHPLGELALDRPLYQVIEIGPFDTSKWRLGE